MEHNLQSRSYGEVKVIFDPHLTDPAGEPVDVITTYEEDASETVLMVTFGPQIPQPDPKWLGLAFRLRAHAGATAGLRWGSGGESASEPTCRECATDDCGTCVRPGGSRLAADDNEYPTCCCGRRFRTTRGGAR